MTDYKPPYGCGGCDCSVPADQESPNIPNYDSPVCAICARNKVPRLDLYHRKEVKDE